MSDPGHWARLNEALDLAQKPLREDFEWLIGEYDRLRDAFKVAHEAGDALWSELGAARDVIRLLLDGWELLDGQWRNESEVDIDGAAVRRPVTTADREAVDKAEADR